MMRLIPVAAVAAVILELGAAVAATPGPLPPSPAGDMVVLAAKKGVIPANCLMDPDKNVYVCCTKDSNGHPVCTEHPLDTDWPVQQRLQQLKQVKPQQTQPLLLQPAQ